MKVIVCLDDKRGMFFNERRQSRDRVLNADVVEMTRGSRLFADPYSKMLFENSDVELVCDADFLELAGKGDFCFVENRTLSKYAERLEQIIIYRWNRSYPGDIFFDLDPEQLGFERVSITEFQGYSHEKITKEIFTR